MPRRAYDGLREPPRRDAEASLPRGGSPRRAARIISNPMQPQFNDEDVVPIGVPGGPVLLPLALPGLQLELLLYTAHGTRESPKLADPKVSRTGIEK